MNATTAPATPEERDHALDALEAVWADRPGFAGWLATVDHKRIARRYLSTAMAFFALGGILALVMRAQLTYADNAVVGPARYDQLFSMHGSVMMFLFAVPAMQAVAVYMVPLMVGARNIAFSRLSAFGYWIYLFGGVVLFLALLGAAPDAGWPDQQSSLQGVGPWSGQGGGFHALLVVFGGIAALCVAVALATTILAMRAPGMTLSRMPLFVWATLVASLLVILATPPALASSALLLSDRLFGTRFQDLAAGGDPLMWRQLSRLLGHPQAFVVLLPALGMVSQIVETFAGRPVVAYWAMVLALVATGVLAFAPWMSPPVGGPHIAAGVVVAIPLGIQVYCWIATLWSGRPRVTCALLFVLGFLALLPIGGLAGVMAASAPLGRQLQGSYFVVGHLHYALVGGAVFPLMGASYYWFPKWTGRLLSETAGRVQFWLFFVGLHLAFLPMYLLGLTGMPRWVYTYAPGLGWTVPNLVATFGAWMIAGSVLLFAANVALTLRRIRGGRPGGDNPWGAADLAWATRSPPPPFDFEDVPVVASRTPLWPLDARLPVMTGLARDKREGLLSSWLAAAPAARCTLPEPTLWPLWSALALGLLLVWSIFQPEIIAWGALPVALTFAAWYWPKRSPAGRESRA